MAELQIAIVGDFDLNKASHWATEAALLHAARRARLELVPTWIPTASLSARSVSGDLARFDGIWAAPGSPYQSADGMLRAIEYARSHDVPFLGTCGGFQYALIEFSRHVLALPDADSAETGVFSCNVVITAIAPSAARPSATPQRSGGELVLPIAGSLLHGLCGAELQGQYFCSFEANRDFEARWEAAGLRVAGRGGAGEMRALWLPSQRFFLGTLFQPQLSSSFERGHPIIEGFARAALAHRERSAS